MSINYSSLDEQNLILLCQKNEDLEAFNEIAKRNSNTIKAYLISKFKDPSKAEEIIQITLIKTWNNIKKYKGKARLLSWMSRIAHNAYYDDCRKYKKETSIEEMKEKFSKGQAAFSHSSLGGDYVENKLGLKETKNNPLRITELKELNKKLTKVIGMLSKEHREVIRMKEIDNLSCQEISLRIKCPYPTVCTRLFYARKKAKEIFSALTND